MAEGDITFYNIYKQAVVAGSVDWDADTIKVALTTTGYTPDIDADEDFADITNEIVAAGYTAGGATLGSKTNVVDAPNNQADVDAANVTWATLATTTITYAIIYHDTGDPATSTLIAYMEISTNSNGNDYTIQWNTGGIFTLS